MWTAAASRLAGAAELVMLNWWVLHATGNPAMIGAVTAARLAPLLIAGPIGGALADRLVPARMLGVIGAFAAVMTAALGAAVLLNVPLWMVVVLLVLRGVVTAAEASVRQLAVVEITGEGRVVKGMADLSTVITLCLVAGPALSGALMSTVGAGWGITLLAGLLLVGSLLAFSVVKEKGGDATVKAPVAEKPQREKQSRFAGWRAIASNPRLAAQVVLAIGPMVAVFPYTSMLPVLIDLGGALRPGSGSIAAGGDSGTWTAIASVAAAVGAVAATLFLRRNSSAQEVRNRVQEKLWDWKVLRPGRLAFFMAALSSVILVLCALSVTHIVVLCAMLVLLGLAGQLYRTSNRAAVIVLAPDEARGAVLGISGMDRVMIPLGSAICGVIASWWGPVAMLLLMAGANAVLMLPAAVLMWRSLRR